MVPNHPSRLFPTQPSFSSLLSILSAKRDGTESPLVYLRPKQTWRARQKGVLTGAPSRLLWWAALVAPQQPLSMAISYAALSAWAADANAKIELIDRDECWIDVIALTDADAARMLQKVQSQSRLAADAGRTRMLQTLQRMTRILQQRTQLGAALVQQRFSTDAALGSLSVLDNDEPELIVRLAGTHAKDLAAIAQALAFVRTQALRPWRTTRRGLLRLRACRSCGPSLNSPSRRLVPSTISTRDTSSLTAHHHCKRGKATCLMLGLLPCRRRDVLSATS